MMGPSHTIIYIYTHKYICDIYIYIDRLYTTSISAWIFGWSWDHALDSSPPFSQPATPPRSGLQLVPKWSAGKFNGRHVGLVLWPWIPGPDFPARRMMTRGSARKIRRWYIPCIHIYIYIYIPIWIYTYTPMYQDIPIYIYIWYNTPYIDI